MSRTRTALTLGILAACSLTGCAGAARSRTSLWQKSSPASPQDGFSQRLTRAEQATEKGKLDEAREAYEKLLVDYPDRPEAYHGLAVVADRQRRHREAQSLYAEAIRLHPVDAQLFNDLGYSFYLDGQLAKADSALSKAVSLAPSQARYRNNLGLVLGQMGRHEEALEQFRRAGSEADAQYNLAFVLASQEKSREAIQCFERALAADPGHERARHALRSFEKFEKDPAACEDPGEMFADGQHWVPFVEGSVPADSQQVLAASGAATSRMSAIGGSSGVVPVSASGPLPEATETSPAPTAGGGS